LILLAWRLWRKRGRHPGIGLFLIWLVFMLPILRILDVPPLREDFREFSPHNLGKGNATLLVCGVDGLDSGLLNAYSSDSELDTFDHNRKEGASGNLRAFRPFLRPALWTTLVTGTLPRRHGVMSPRGWILPRLFKHPLRLLPWTPQGSRLFLPWGRGIPVPPSESSIPPLWKIIAGETSLPGTSIDWPGFRRHQPPPDPEGWIPDHFRHLRDLLITGLDLGFPREKTSIIEAIDRDLDNFTVCRDLLENRISPIFLHLGALEVARKHLEPHGPEQPRRRELLGEVLKIENLIISDLFSVAGEDSLRVIVSPYGMRVPDSWEKLRRLLGSGNTWRASPKKSTPGVFILRGNGVIKGAELGMTDSQDIAPTLCYLLGLPVPHYMEGRVILDALEPAWAAEHPLRVIDCSVE